MLFIWLSLHVYLLWRLATIPFVARHVPPRIIGFAGILFCVSFPSMDYSGLGTVGRILTLIGADWLGVAFLVFLTVFAADLVTGFGFFFRQVAPGVRVWAFVVGSLLAAFAIVQGTRAPVVSSYDVQLPNLPLERDRTVLVVASDLHLGALLGERWLAQRVEQIKAERPDLIVLAGDLVEGHGEGGRQFVPVLRGLTAPLGVWAVTGNHDAPRRADRAADRRPGLLEDAGFHVLHDQWVQVAPGLIISGVDDLTSRRRGNLPLGSFVDRALAGRPSGGTLFVSHTPWLMDGAASDGAGLMLSGHTHNGQIWPFTYFVQRSYALMAGKHEVNGMPLIICRGTGTWGPHMRLWQPSEIVRVTLRSSRRLRAEAHRRIQCCEVQIANKTKRLRGRRPMVTMIASPRICRLVKLDNAGQDVYQRGPVM